MAKRPRNEVEYVPIPLDPETIVGLARLGRMLGDHPAKIAAALLRDIVREDALEHAEVPSEILN